jgi:hypothetical protein
VGPRRRVFLESARKWEATAQSIHDSIPEEDHKHATLYNGTNYLPSWWQEDHSIENLRLHPAQQITFFSKKTNKKYGIFSVCRSRLQ